MRDLAQEFFKMEVRNGKDTCFWYDNWSKYGCLKDVLGDNRFDLGISHKESVAEVFAKHRRRRHRVPILNEVENEIEDLQQRNCSEDDISLRNREMISLAVASQQRKCGHS